MVERSQLLELTWDDFGGSFKYIIIDGRKIELCRILQRYLSQLYKEQKQNRVKKPYVLQLYYNSKRLCCQHNLRSFGLILSTRKNKNTPLPRWRQREYLIIYSISFCLATRLFPQ